MSTVTIRLSRQDYDALTAAALKKGVSIEEWAADAVHLLLSTHTIDYGDYERGYQNSENCELI